MRLYCRTTKRIAKKIIGDDWTSLNLALKLRPGNLVSACVGYNCPIKTIVPVWTYYPTKFSRRIICDFDIEVIYPDGSTGWCSWMQCCSKPLETKSQIIKFWIEDTNHEPVKTLLKAGRNVFEEDGQLKYEYLSVFQSKG
jgi:hypothetical protein